VAKFVGKEDALCFGMGFATNSTNMPILTGPVRGPT
jgi:serine palmitoyltransferase